MKKISFIVCLTIFLFSENSWAGPMQDYNVKWYFLNLQVNDTNTFIRGSAQVWVTVISDSLPVLVLQLTDSLQVDSVRINGKRYDFIHDQDTLSIPLFPAPRRNDLVKPEVYYHGQVTTGSFFSAMTSKENTRWHQRVTWTLSEPYAAKDWFPCKQDLGDKADSCAVWVTVQKGLAAGSNGLLEGVDTIDNGNFLRYRWHHRHPIDYYLISLAVSNYQTYDIYAHPQGCKDSVLIQNMVYSDTGYLPAEKDHIGVVVPALELYSRLYSCYPFADEKYGHCLAPMGGGMEHQTMTTLDNFGFDMVVHELAHQWFGDHVTCASWQDIWINEGFASYSEYISREYLKGQDVAGDWMNTAHNRALKETDGSVYVPFNELNNIYRIFNGNLSYKKGASIIHMIRYELNNDSLFFKVFRTFQKEFGDSVATGADFRDVLTRVSGIDFTGFFDQWYYGRGYPLYAFSWNQNHDSLYIQSVQTPSGSTPLFKMHMDLLIRSDKKDTLVRVYQDRNDQFFIFPFKDPVVQIIPDPDNWLLMEVSSVSHVVDKCTGNDIILYPNPVSQTLSLYLAKTVPGLNVRIMGSGGQVINSCYLQQYPYRLDVSNLPEGIYIVEINEGNDRWIKKFIKMK